MTIFSKKFILGVGVWLSLFFIPVAYGQTPLIGKIIDEQQQPIAFASIYPEKYPQQGVVSDYDGVFVLDSLRLRETIVVSFIGYRTIELQLKKY